MLIHEALRLIDETGLDSPFVLTFCKADGTLRDMVAMKRNRMRSAGTNKAAEGSDFKYSLSQKNLLLLNELTGFEMINEQTAIGTHKKPKQQIDISNLRHNLPTAPRAVKIFSIRAFNGQIISHE